MSILDQVDAFDATVERAVDRVRSPQLDAIAYRLSSAADHSLLWQACGIAQTLVRGDDPRRAVRFALAIGAESALTNGALKLVFRRMRPRDYSEIEFPHGLRRPITTSFPSGHATAAFTAATLLGGGPWYALAAAVAATRVYVRLHHASDVAAGAALGLALGAALRPLVR